MYARWGSGAGSETVLEAYFAALNFSFCHTHLKIGSKDAGTVLASFEPLFRYVRQKLKFSDANYAVRTLMSDPAGFACLLLELTLEVPVICCSEVTARVPICFVCPEATSL